jgi:hypothetical protein
MLRREHGLPALIAVLHERDRVQRLQEYNRWQQSRRQAVLRRPVVSALVGVNDGVSARDLRLVARLLGPCTEVQDGQDRTGSLVLATRV